MSAFAAAHRGLSGEVPENTEAAFAAARKAGFTAIELDVRLTADREVVCLHDAGIDRTTTGAGRVADMRFDDLRRWDTGAGPVPRLDDVLAAAKGWEGWWDIEVKTRHATVAVIELLRHHDLLDRAHFTSMDPRALEVAVSHAPGLSRGLIVLGAPDAEDLRYAAKHGATWIHGDATALDAAKVERTRSAGFRVGAWTVNDPATARRLAEAGVECIFTDVRAVRDVAPASAAF